MKATQAALCVLLLTISSATTARAASALVDWYPDLAPGFTASLLESGLDRPSPCIQGIGAFNHLYVATGDGYVRSVGEVAPIVFPTSGGDAEGLALATEGDFQSYLYTVLDRTNPAIARFDSSGARDGAFSFLPEGVVENGIAFGPGGAAFGQDLYIGQYVTNPDGSKEGKITRVAFGGGSLPAVDIVSLGDVPPLGMVFAPSPEGMALYVAEQDENRVRYVYYDQGQYKLKTFYIFETFYGPRALAVSPGGGFGDGYLYVGDFFADKIFRVPLLGGPAEIVAGFREKFTIKGIAFTNRNTLAVTGTQAGLVVDIHSGVPEPGFAALTGLLLGWIARRRTAAGQLQQLAANTME